MSGYEMVELKTIIVGIIVAIFTTLFTGYLKKPKKEKATGYFEIKHSDKIETYHITPFIITADKKITLNFWINNIGNADIVLNCKKGFFLKTKNGEKIILSANENNLFIPRKMKNQAFSDVLIFFDNNDKVKVLELYNKDCTILVYTMKGTEIELKKFSNKDPLEIGKKKEIAVGK